MRRHFISRAVVGLLLTVGLLVASTLPVGAQTDAGSPSETVAGLAGSTTGFSFVESLGLFDPLTATWYLRDSVGRTSYFEFGEPGSVGIVGDWDGDGFDTPAYYRPWDGFAAIRNTNGAGRIEGVQFLASDGIPVAADCDGDGRDAISMVVNGRLVIGDVPPDTVPARVPDGVTAATAVDFDGDGRDEILVRAAGSWWLDGRIVDAPDLGPDARPVAGDFDGDGAVALAMFRPGNAEFWIYNGLASDAGASIMPFGSSRMLPVAGRFGVPEGNEGIPPRMLNIPPLTKGDTAPEVARLQAELAARALYRGPITGTYGSETAYAVMALHKEADVERTWDWEEGDTDLLALFEPGGFPYREDEPDRIEVDITRQVLFFIEDHEVSAIVPVSTGGGYTYYSERAEANVSARTPRGDFELLRYSGGWSCDPLYGWCIYKPWNFTSVYAIHGYNSVPAYPASHGCVRLPNWDADILEDQWYIGLPVHVWDTPPEDLPLVGE